jgi:hypothetical protein
MSRQELLAKIYSELVVKTLMVVGPVEVETYSDVYKENCEALYKIAKIASREYNQYEYM